MTLKSFLITIREAFSKSPPLEELQTPLGDSVTPAAREERDKEILRRVVRSRSSGNVFLHRGRYVTREELDERRERILAHQWDDE